MSEASPAGQPAKSLAFAFTPAYDAGLPVCASVLPITEMEDAEMLSYLITVGAVVLLIVAFVLRRRGTKEREPTYHFQCNHCHQKMRYRAASQGLRIMCPHCLRLCTVPSVTTDATHLNGTAS
jgi:hypothetical protein